MAEDARDAAKEEKELQKQMDVDPVKDREWSQAIVKACGRWLDNTIDEIE